MDAARTTEVGRLVAAAHRAAASARARSLAGMADEHWRRAAALSDSPGRRRVALLHAEEYARAAFLAADPPALPVSVPQD